MKVYCIILAGGVGTRMGGETPKQFLLLKGTPIIIRTIRQVMTCNEFEKIVVAIHPEWRRPFESMLCKYGIDIGRIIIVSGGKERLDSLTNAISAIRAYDEIAETDLAVIHDAVRPFISMAVLKESIRISAEFGACVATLPAVDTMLEIDNGIVKAVPPRSRLFNGQSPDSARILLLEQAIQSLTPDERRTITGTAQILVVKGIPVKAISGDYRNIKITNPIDMVIAERYLDTSI